MSKGPVEELSQNWYFIGQHWQYLIILSLPSMIEGVWDDWVQDQVLWPNTNLTDFHICSNQVGLPWVGGILSTPSSGFSCVEMCHLRHYSFGIWCYWGQNSPHRNSYKPLTTSVDGSSSFPSPAASAAKPTGLAVNKVMKHSFCFTSPGKVR